MKSGVAGRIRISRGTTIAESGGSLLTCGIWKDEERDKVLETFGETSKPDQSRFMQQSVTHLSLWGE